MGIRKILDPYKAESAALCPTASNSSRLFSRGNRVELGAAHLGDQILVPGWAFNVRLWRAPDLTDCHLDKLLRVPLSLLAAVVLRIFGELLGKFKE